MLHWMSLKDHNYRNRYQSCWPHQTVTENVGQNKGLNGTSPTSPTSSPSGPKWRQTRNVQRREHLCVARMEPHVWAVGEGVRDARRRRAKIDLYADERSGWRRVSGSFVFACSNPGKGKKEPERLFLVPISHRRRSSRRVVMVTRP